MPIELSKVSTGKSVAESGRLSLERDFYGIPMQRTLRRIVRGNVAKERRLLREAAIGRVFPDVLLGEWKQTLPKATGRRLTIKECVILSALARNDQTALSLESGRTASAVIEGAEPALLKLAALGLVERRARNRWSVSTPSPVWNCRVTAIEAKLLRWQDALSQALTYRLFAHRSFVLLDGAQTSLSRAAIRAFESTGVGLLLRYPRRIVLDVEAADVAPDSFERLFAIDKLWHRGVLYSSRAQSV